MLINTRERLSYPTHLGDCYWKHVGVCEGVCDIGQRGDPEFKDFNNKTENWVLIRIQPAEVADFPPKVKQIITLMFFSGFPLFRRSRFYIQENQSVLPQPATNQQLTMTVCKASCFKHVVLVKDSKNCSYLTADVITLECRSYWLIFNDWHSLKKLF